MEQQYNLTSNTFKRAESSLQGRLKAELLKHYPHNEVPKYNLNRVPFLDEWDVDSAIGLYQEFPYHSDLLKPLMPPARLPRTVINEIDPAIQLLSTKSHINDDINRILEYYKKYQTDLGSVYKKDIDCTSKYNSFTAKVPRYIADIAELMDKDPDPYFKGTYNWYYTGGALSSVQFNDQNILLFSYMNELVATPICINEDLLWKPVLQNAAKCEVDGTLYELKHCNIGNASRILGRYKNHCSFYTLHEKEGKLKLYEVDRQKSKLPYVSADLSLLNANQCCVLNAGRSITLWDITKMKPINSGSVLHRAIQEDVWGIVSFQLLDPNIIIFVDRFYIYQIDLRTSVSQPVLTLNIKSSLEECEEICVDVPSRNASYRYVGTSHSLLMYDNRISEQCVQQKWTHQFKSAPVLARVTNRYDHEIIVLSSQIAGETAIIVNTWTSDHTSHSFNLPFCPPSIMDTLNESQMQGKCLDPHLKTRLELSNVGSTLTADKNGNVFLFLQNSVGDIFYQCFTHESGIDKYSVLKSVDALAAWEYAILQQNPTVVPLTISDKCDMQHIYENFTNKRLSIKYKKQDDNNDFDPSWKQSLDKLNCYMDILAPEILSVWEVTEDVPVPLSAAPVQKVLSWLESASTKASLLSQEESEYIPSPINTQELISASQEADITCIDDSNELQFLLPRVNTKPMKKKRR